MDRDSFTLNDGKKTESWSAVSQPFNKYHKDRTVFTTPETLTWSWLYTKQEYHLLNLYHSTERTHVRKEL
jgi:hypothetical protein